MSKSRVKPTIVYEDITSLYFFFVSLIYDSLGNRRVCVHYLCCFDLLRQLDYISCSILKGLFLWFLPASSVDVTKLGLSLKI